MSLEKGEVVEALWSILHDSNHTRKIEGMLSQLSGEDSPVLLELNDKQYAEEKKYARFLMVDLWIKRLREHGFEVTEGIVKDAEKYCSAMPHGKSYFYWSLASVFASMKSNECIPLSQKAFISVVGVHGDSNELFRFVSGYNRLRRERVYKKKFRRAFSMIYQMFDLNSKVCNLRPTIFVVALCKEMELTRDVRRYANRLAKRVVESNLHVGHHPLAVASAIVYISGIVDWEHKKTMREIARVAGITGSSLRANTRFITDELAIDYDEAVIRAR